MRDKAVIVLGGGLWGGLLAYRWQQLYPDVKFLLVEAEEKFGGNHTWCFHENDISTEAKNWINPFIVNSWNGYKVKFPAYEKKLDIAYHALNSENFHKVILRSLPQDSYSLSTKMNLDEAISKGSWVIDARGIFESRKIAYQKFLGFVLELDHPHGLDQPILMDAKVSQIDGFRFIYSLPFGTHEVLVEDTRYSISDQMNESELKHEILSYAHERGWKIKQILRKERGILPLPLSRIDYKESEAIHLGGIFHDTTGYSLPDAVRLIDLLLERSPSQENFRRVLKDYKRERESDRRFFRLLNWFMFHASSESERYRMLEFFYRHSPKLISQFYSGKLTAFGKLRFFVGRPPVSVLRAIREAMV